MKKNDIEKRIVESFAPNFNKIRREGEDAVNPFPFSTFEELVAMAPQHIKDELDNLKGYQENPKYHPEPNAYLHVRHVTSRLMKTGDINLVLAGLYHDIGKQLAADQTFEHGLKKLKAKEGKTIDDLSPEELEQFRAKNYRAFGHEDIGAEWVMKDREFITNLGGDVDDVHEIVKNHMKIKNYNSGAIKKKAKLEKIKNLKNFDKLQTFTTDGDDMSTATDDEKEYWKNWKDDRN